MNINVSLSPSSLDKTIKDLEKYKATMIRKLRLLVDQLIEVGIDSGIANSGQYEGMIVFRRMVVDNIDGVEGVLVATDGVKLIKEWKYQGGIKQAEVSPLLMAEFGSGWLAKVLDNVEGVGQGTFPDQTHAFDANGWWWETPDGEKHHSYGEAPTYPVHSALYTMIFEVERIARGIFRE